MSFSRPALVRSAARLGSAGLLCVAVVLSGCATSWKTRQAAPEEVLRSTGETEVQVILTNGARVVLRDPGVEGDSLVGWSKPKPAELPERQAFALADIHALATRKNNVPLNLTLGLLTGTAVAFGLAGGIRLLCYSAGCD